MNYPSWQSSRKHTADYTPRQPWNSPLYRLVYHYREEFEYRWSELFESELGFLRNEVLDAFDRYLNCGILRHGAARAQCQKCKHSILIAFSCKRRGICPSCQAKRSVIFAENMHRNILLEQEHRHIIFSLPKRLRIYFRFDRSLFKLLYRAAWDTWTEHLKQQMPNAKTGAVMALHSAGDLLHWHPHIHMLALNGAVLDDGHFLKLSVLDQEQMQACFADKIFEALLQHQLISEDTVNSMKSWEHSGFNVYAGGPIAADDQDARLFLARYLKKAPLAEARLCIDDSGLEPTIQYSKTTDDGTQTRSFSPLQFLAELSLHIPKTFEQTSRMFGIYSSSTRGKLARIEREKQYLHNNWEPTEEKQNSSPASKAFARCMKLVFEIDPLKCSRCGENMKIIAFLHSAQAIQKIADNLGMPTWRAPPPIAPLQQQYDFCSEFAQA